MKSQVGYSKFRVFCFELGRIWDIQGSFRFKTATANFFREVSGFTRNLTCKNLTKRTEITGTRPDFWQTAHPLVIYTYVLNFINIMSELGKIATLITSRKISRQISLKIFQLSLNIIEKTKLQNYP